MRSVLATLALFLATVTQADVVIRDYADQTVVRYDHSYALLIGVSDYTAGWRDLTSIPDELDQVEAVLVEHGFEVTKVIDPTEDALRDAFEAFIDAHGYVASHRLLVYFAGHGYSVEEDGKQQGYLVPSDAPRPTDGLPRFKSKAVAMVEVDTWARRIGARHALFVFDSCFSGTVFDARSELPQPMAVSAKMARRVRQFLTAGSADEEVPGKSQFTPAFVEALRGAADLVPDGYVTGTELGVYLDQKARLPRQTPQFGRLAGYHQGDFVFRLDVAPAPDVTIDLSDLRERSTLEASWAEYQRSMESTFDDVAEVEALGGTQATKAEAWRRFLDAFEQDNPFSKDDERLRADAGQRLKRLGLDESVRPVEPAPAVPVSVERQAGDLWIEPTSGMRFRYIPAGTFRMGSPKDEVDRQEWEFEPHEVTLSQGYWMAETEVTQAQWRALMDNDPSASFNTCGDECPVVGVTWSDAVAFANALSEKAGHTPCYLAPWSDGNRAGEGLDYPTVDRVPGCDGFRLPTEAEWERAARAGTTTPLYTGELNILDEHRSPDLDPIAWYIANSEVDYAGGRDCSEWAERPGEARRCGTLPVGQKRPNRWGLHDMLGNVWEWTWDRFGHEAQPATDPDGAPQDSRRVYRGGSWENTAQYVRVTFRATSERSRRSLSKGFRLARSAQDISPEEESR